MGGLFSSPKAPMIPKPISLPPYVPPPEPEPIVPLPTASDEAIQEKKKREAIIQSKKSGRASTFLSDDEDGKLG